MKEKKKGCSICILFFLSFFFLHFYQLLHQHWSGVLDQDEKVLKDFQKSLQESLWSSHMRIVAIKV